MKIRIWLKVPNCLPRGLYQHTKLLLRHPGSDTSFIPSLYSSSWAVSVFSSPGTSHAPALFLPEEKEWAEMNMPNYALGTLFKHGHLPGTSHSVIEGFSGWYPALLPPHVHPLPQQKVSLHPCPQYLPLSPGLIWCSWWPHNGTELNMVTYPSLPRQPHFLRSRWSNVFSGNTSSSFLFIVKQYMLPVKKRKKENGKQYKGMNQARSKQKFPHYLMSPEIIIINHFLNIPLCF